MLLFRPTGLSELKLVADTGWRGWPPRLPDQPIFYPVLTRDYARKIARDWNSVDRISDFIGFVSEFEIDSAYARQFDVQTVAGRSHQELWVLAELWTVPDVYTPAECADFIRRLDVSTPRLANDNPAYRDQDRVIGKPNFEAG